MLTVPFLSMSAFGSVAWVAGLLKLLRSKDRSTRLTLLSPLIWTGRSPGLAPGAATASVGSHLSDPYSEDPEPPQATPTLTLPGHQLRPR